VSIGVKKTRAKAKPSVTFTPPRRSSVKATDLAAQHRAAVKPRASVTAKAMLADKSSRPTLTQHKVAVIDTRCKGCDDFTPHRVTKVSFSQFGKDPHHVLTCQQCGNERRLETVTEVPSGGCWVCTESAIAGELLCASCKLVSQEVRQP
jgi:RNase P subunit RPR2